MHPLLVAAGSGSAMLVLAFPASSLGLQVSGTVFARWGDGYAGPADWVTLVVQPSVIAELALTDGQRSELEAVSQGYRRTLRQHYAAHPDETPASSPELRAKATGLRQETDSRIAAILEEEQERRLNQIRWQILGGEALFDKPVATALDLTSQQQDRLSAARKENEIRRGEMLEKLKRLRLTGEGLTKIEAECQAAADERLLGVLTERQREAFLALKGEKFEPR